MDYIVKPFEPLILKAKVAFFVQFYRKDQQLQKANRELTAVQLRLQEANEILQNLNANLEQQVCKRTADLQAKNEELNTVLQQLWQAAKLATMGELASSIAHELNNPLATVSLRIESLTAQTPEGDKRLRELEIIGQEVGRMGNLVTNLLQFSRRSQKQISTVDLREEIEKPSNLLSTTFAKTISRSSGSLHRCSGDPRRPPAIKAVVSEPVYECERRDAEGWNADDPRCSAPEEKDFYRDCRHGYRNTP